MSRHSRKRPTIDPAIRSTVADGHETRCRKFNSSFPWQIRIVNQGPHMANSVQQLLKHKLTHKSVLGLVDRVETSHGQQCSAFIEAKTDSQDCTRTS